MVANRTNLSRRQILKVVGVGGITGLAGCMQGGGGSNPGGNNSGGGSNESGGGRNSTGGSDDGSTYTLGNIQTLSGSAAIYGNPLQNGFLMALEDIKPFNIDGDQYTFGRNTIDDQCENSQAISAARKLITQNGRKYIVGTICSNAAQAMSSFVQGQTDALQFPNGAASQVVTRQNDQFIRNAFTGMMNIPPARVFINDADPDKILLFGDELHPASESQINVLKPILSENRDVRVMWHDRDQQDYSTLIQKMKQYDPDLIWTHGIVPDVYRFFDQARQAGLDTPAIEFSATNVANVKDVLSDPAPLKEVYSVQGSTTVALAKAGYEPAVAYRKRYKDKFNEDPYYLAGANYDLMFALTMAMEQAGTVDDSLAVRDELLDLTVDDLTSRMKGSPIGGPAQDYVPVGDDGLLFDQYGQSWFKAYLREWDGFELNVTQTLKPKRVGYYYEEYI